MDRKNGGHVGAFRHFFQEFRLVEAGVVLDMPITHFYSQRDYFKAGDLLLILQVIHNSYPLQFYNSFVPPIIHYNHIVVLITTYNNTRLYIL